MHFPDETAPASDENPFVITPTGCGFENLGHENGFRYWWASDLARILGYQGYPSFRKAVERAMTTLTSLGIEVTENIVPKKREVNGKEESDFRLSRFACYLAAMNGDPKKPQVAQAQAYFAAWAQAIQCSLQEAEQVERVAIRAEMSDHEKTLAGVASNAGVQNYAFFQSAGYRGMYNMSMEQLRRAKGIPVKRSLLDFMGKTELAANLFRVTQTEEKIRAEGTRGQIPLERTAAEVGRKVRATMIEISGRKPEDLPPAPDIKEVHKSLKTSHRTIKKLDGPKK